MTDPRTARLVSAYTALTRENLAALLALYADGARFKDPFNDVRGRAAIGRVFGHMFDELVDPRFAVQVAVTEGDDAFLTWEMQFRRVGSREPFFIRGASHLHYDAAGLVVLHRDYWDAAEELYAKLPVLGWLMRALRRRLATPGVGQA